MAWCWPRGIWSTRAGRAAGIAVPWFQHPVYRYWQLGPPPEGVHVIAPFSDDGPAILERPLGKGRAITMTTPVSDSPTAIRGISCRSTAAFLRPPRQRDGGIPGRRREPGLELLRRGDGRVGPRSGARAAHLRADRADGVQVRLTPDLKQQRLVVASTELPGNYRVQAGGSAEGVDRGFSVNIRPDLTRLERRSDDELAGLLARSPSVSRGTETRSS